MARSCLGPAGGRGQERGRRVRRKGRDCRKKAIPFTHVLNSSPELERLEKAEKKQTASEKTER